LQFQNQSGKTVQDFKELLTGQFSFEKNIFRWFLHFKMNVAMYLFITVNDGKLRPRVHTTRSKTLFR